MMMMCSNCGEKEVNGIYKSKYSHLCLVCKQATYRKNKYEKNKDKILARAKKWRQENKDKINETRKAWVSKNKEHLREYGRKRYKEKKDQIKKIQKKYYENNKHIYRKNAALYFANRKSNTPSFILECPIENERVKNIYRLRQIITEATGVEHHVDHMWPLADGGPHWSGNMQIISAEENIKKSGTVDTAIKETIKSMLEEEERLYG
jgi:hypothetical protein